MTPKIATCCYCGTRAALVLDRGLHELTCGSCGAPLHEMKFMPLDRRQSDNTERSAHSYSRRLPKKSTKISTKRYRPRMRLEDILDHFEDLVEEIFD